MELRELTTDDLDAMLACEHDAWIPPFQADRETIASRLEQGHTYLGAFTRGELAGMAAFVQVDADPRTVLDDPQTYFSSFTDFYDRQDDPDGDLVFLYSVGVRRTHRRQGIGSRLAQAAEQRAEQSSARHLILDGRCPAYAGSHRYQQEDIDRDEAFRSALDQHQPGGPAPDRAVLEQDPVLACYFGALDCRVLAVLPSFFPDDPATDGYRVMLVTRTGE